MNKLALAAVALVMNILAPSTSKPAELQIEPAPQTAVDATIPWVVDGDAAWQKAPPAFTVTDASGLAASGWLATTDTDLLVRVEVRDKTHLNTRTGSEIWNGDFLRVAVDGRGDGTAGGAVDIAGTFGDDDASIGFALTPTGAQGFVYSSGDPTAAGAYPAELLKFTRDDATATTVYDIRLPWKRLHVRPGVLPSFGIVVQVRSIDAPDQPEPVHVRWGDGANEPKPGLFRKVAVASPPLEMAGAIPAVTEIWERGDRAAVAVAVASKDPVSVTARVGATTVTREIAGDPTLAIRRLRVTFGPDRSADAPLAVTLSRPGLAEPLATASIDITIADAVARRLLDRLEGLIAQGGHPLFVRHLRSVKAMVEAEWARATIYKKSNPALAHETLGYLRSLQQGFDGDSARWASYLDDGRPLFMAYVSPRDGTLQWYTLTLPAGWDADTLRDAQPAYPMYFELHGAGNPHYLNNAAAQLGAAVAAASGLLGYERSQTYAQIARKGYHVYPFGRGNSGYRDIGATDVWEAYNDAQKTVKIDPDRRYLYGFSMGGGGTWNLGSRTPDRWAAIAVLGMGARVGEWGQAANVANLPIFIWGGETDTIAYRGTPKELITRFADAIRAAGGTVDASSTPNVGHTYTGEVQERSYTWLGQHRRKRPPNFSFTADTDEHRGVWGITMTRDLQVSALPRIDVQIDGSTVRITATGTPRIDVNAGPDGLGLAGDITITLNGKQVFQGPAPAKPLRFDLDRP